jgi:hypothetical protein
MLSSAEIPGKYHYARLPIFSLNKKDKINMWHLIVSDKLRITFQVKRASK